MTDLGPLPERFDEPIHFFIGTSPEHYKADAALEQSIHEAEKDGYDITWMKKDTNPWWTGWLENDDWYTGFTNFRWSVPIVARALGYERAVYLDSDVLVLQSVREIAGLEFYNRPWICRTDEPVRSKGGGASQLRYKTDVSFIDCSIALEPWYPTMKQLKRGDYSFVDMIELLAEHDQFEPLPRQFNCIDGTNPAYSEEQTKILHYSRVDTQPWRPDGHPHKPHPLPQLVQLWEDFWRRSQIKETT